MSKCTMCRCRFTPTMQQYSGTAENLRDSLAAVKQWQCDRRTAADAADFADGIFQPYPPTRFPLFVD